MRTEIRKTSTKIMVEGTEKRAWTLVVFRK